MFHHYLEDRGRLPLIVVVPTGCWIWTGSLSGSGYPRWWTKDKDYGRCAHRVIWELFNGPVPEGFELDHLCRVTVCVNPGHLEPVPASVNKHRRNQANGWRTAA